MATVDARTELARSTVARALGQRVLAVVLLTVLTRLVFGLPALNPDGLYSVVWGSTLARGEAPDYVDGMTPHPLAIGVVAAQHLLLGDASFEAARWLAPLNWAVLLVLVFDLARHWSTPLAGVLAAAAVAVSPRFVGLLLSGNQDLAAATLVLAALLMSARRAPVRLVQLVLLAAGLLRPELWLVAGLHALWVTARSRSFDLPTLLVPAVAPLLWALTDLLVTGDALWSLTYTQDLAEELGRTRGLANAPLAYVDAHLTLALPPALLLGAFGLRAVLRERRPGTAELLGLLGASALSYLMIGVAGLSLIPRYALLSALVLTLLAGVAADRLLRQLVGRAAAWSPRRRTVAAVATALLVLATAVPVLSVVHQVFQAERDVFDERTAALGELAALEPVMRRCLPVHRPMRHGAVPATLAYLLEAQPADLPTTVAGTATSGSHLVYRGQDQRSVLPGTFARPAAAAGRPLATTEHWTLVGIDCPVR